MLIKIYILLNDDTVFKQLHKQMLKHFIYDMCC